MSAEEIQSLLQAEGVDEGQVDDLVAWASERAAELLLGLEDDPELSGILSGEASDRAAPVLAPVADGPNLAAAGSRPTGSAEAFDREVTQPHARLPHDAADLPPIPSGAREDVEEIEEIDADELEILDEEELEDGRSSDMPALADGPVGPDGRRIDAAAAAEAEAEAGQPDPHGDADADPAAAPEPPAPPEDEGPRFGPPDGTDEVPAWKAALFSAQTGDDALAAKRVKEESSAGYLPEANEASYQEIGRLEPEEEEISQHSVDLSDLDGDPARESSGDAEAAEDGTDAEIPS